MVLQLSAGAMQTAVAVLDAERLGAAAVHRSWWSLLEGTSVARLAPALHTLLISWNPSSMP